MITQEKFSVKVDKNSLKSYLSHFYRSQDYRIIDDGNTLTVIPFNILTPFASLNKMSKDSYMIYNFEQKEHETAVSFSYYISLAHKLTATVLPLFFIGFIYLIIRLKFGQLVIFDLIIALLFLSLVGGYSYWHTRNLEKHIVHKNQKIFKDLETFAHEHLKRGLLESSFIEL